MKGENAVVQFGNHNINFSVKRSKRRRTVSLFIDPHKGIYLRAPFGPSLKALSKLVHSKGVWILKKQKQIEEVKEFLPEREFVSGESYLYLGRQFRLKVNTASIFTKPDINVKNGRFVINLSRHYTESGKKRVVRNALIHWYRLHAYKILLNRAELYAKKLNVCYANLRLANQSKRWGSCSYKDIVRLNWHIIMAPMPLVDYVLVHELCHLKLKNHSVDFWKLLGTVMPDYELRRERLRKEGMKYYL